MKEIKKLKQALSSLDYCINEGIVYSNKDITELEIVYKQLQQHITTIKTFNIVKGYNPEEILNNIKDNDILELKKENEILIQLRNNYLDIIIFRDREITDLKQQVINRTLKKNREIKELKTTIKTLSGGK